MNPAGVTTAYSCRVVQGLVRGGRFYRRFSAPTIYQPHSLHNRSFPTPSWQQQRFIETVTHDATTQDDEAHLNHTKAFSGILICNHGLLSNSSLLRYNTIGPCGRCNLLNISNSLSGYNPVSNIYKHDATWMVVRSIHRSCSVWKEESKVEQTVKALKEQTPPPPEAVEAIPQPKKDVDKPVKKSIGQRIVDELKHYYHGFRLLFIDIRICVRLLWQVLNGKTLSRRERRQLVRTTADMFRLVPFLVFIIVPFMEFLLPVAVKLFPNMLPSTFAVANKVQEKIKKRLKVKLEMAKFLQDTLEESAVLKTSGDQKSAQDFAAFIHKIRTSGETASTEEILKYSQLFEDEITLDNLRYEQLAALCRLLDIPTLGSKNFLGFQLRVKLRQLETDDRMIQKEGIDALNVWELQDACRARGMRALGMSKDRLKMQLQQWLDMHLNSNVPTSLLLLSRTLYLPVSLSVEDQLQATISSLPETSTTEATVKVSEVAGERVDNKAKLDQIRQEDKALKEQEKEEKETLKAQEEKQKAEEEAKKELLETPEQLQAEQAIQEAQAAKEELIDTAPILEDQAAPVLEDKAEKIEDDAISPDDIKEVEVALESIAEEESIKIEEEELKEAHEEYKEDLADLREAVIQTGGAETDIIESKAAKRLSKKVNKMIAQIDSVIVDLSAEEAALREDIEVKEVKVSKIKDSQADARQEQMEEISEQKHHLIGIEELVFAMRRLQKVPDDAKLQRIAEIVQALDIDKDGAIDLGDSLKVLEVLGQENIKISSSQMKEIASLLRQETDQAEEEKLKEKEQKQAAQEAACQESRDKGPHEAQKQ